MTDPGTSGDLGPALERLPGVLAATVFSDPSRAPRVYLATSAQADREALLSAVLALIQDYGMAGDPSRVHMASPPRGSLPAGSLPRFSLDFLDVHRTSGRAECVVQLRTEIRTLSASASEPDTVTGRARAAARAILLAAESVDPDLRLGLHGTRSLDLFGHESVVVLVEAAAGRAHAHLPGAALVDRSMEEAAALATLTALRSWGL